MSVPPAPPQVQADRVPAGLPCPVCRVDLVMSDRQGVEIDYCPKCRGVWLDRGELDKILELSLRQAVDTARNAPTGNPASAPGYPPENYDNRGPAGYGDRDRPSGGHGSKHDSGHGGSSYGGSHGGRRKSWLSELFD